MDLAQYLELYIAIIAVFTSLLQTFMFLSIIFFYFSKHFLKFIKTRFSHFTDTDSYNSNETIGSPV